MIGTRSVRGVGANRQAHRSLARRPVGTAEHTQRLGHYAVEFWQTLTNHSSHPLRVRRIRLLDGVLKCTDAAWDVVHGEHSRAERYFGGFTLLPNRFREPVDRFEGMLGLSEDTPFPALLFTHRERGTVLLGVLSQERCKPVWTLSRPSGTLRLTVADWILFRLEVIRGTRPERVTLLRVPVIPPGTKCPSPLRGAFEQTCLS